jgi:hypothetical protein
MLLLVSRQKAMAHRSLLNTIYQDKMKDIKYYVAFFQGVILCSVLIALLFSVNSCASTPSETTGHINLNVPLGQGSKGEGIRLAVLQPKGVNIPQNQAWFLSMIQGALTSDFNKFSKMTVLDRQYLDDILAEQNLSMNGNFSDDDYIRIGHLTNAQYILIGSLTKTTANNFLLDLAITNTETGERRASFGPKQYTLADIQNMLAVKDAAYELLMQIGIEFSALGKKNLYETAQTSVAAETALAKGITAERSGATLVEVMQYYYQAVDYDAKMTEAIGRLAETNGKLTGLTQPLAVVPTGNIREDALAQIAAYKIEQENKRIDEENKKVWLKQLADCETYFTGFFQNANAPLELIYATDIKPVGAIDMQNETMSLQFETTLVPLSKSWFRAAQQTVESIRKGLIETGRAKDWGLADWPKKSTLSPTPFTNERRNYNISVELIDEHDTSIGTTSFTLSGGWDCVISSQNVITFNPYYDIKVIPVAFNAVKIADITDTLSIHIVTINNKDAEITAENGVLAITPDNQRIKQAIAKVQNQAQKEKTAAYFSGLWSDRWYSARFYCEPFSVGNYYGFAGIGMELGLRHFTLGASFGFSGSYDFIGDFSLGYSIYYIRDGGVIKMTIGPGITMQNDTNNLSNFPSLWPYLQINFAPLLFGFVIKLALPVINGKITPTFVLGSGLGAAWVPKKN